VEINLPPQPAKVLVLLATRAGQLVTRDELRQQIWGKETFVDFEHGLNSCIKQIRAALDDHPETPRYIETRPRRGYRFIAPVQEVPAGVVTPGAPSEGLPITAQRAGPRRFWIAVVGLALTLFATGYFARLALTRHAVSPAEKIMLAVLPFENLTGDARQEYLSDGLTEEMITQLGRLHPERLGVIARTSAMQYKSTHKAADQIGRELGVGYLLEGSLRRAGDHVRVSAQLIQVRDQTHLWAESYERDLRDILALQSDVAQAIAWQIDVRLSPQQEARMARVRPIDPRVYELYSKGRYFWNKRSEEGYTRAIHYFEQAIARDPEYAQPYAGLADAYALLGSMPNVELPRSEAMPRARAAALKALALDEGLAEAHTSLAFVQMHFDWDWPAAEREFARALELNPGYATAHHWYAFWLIAQGRAEEALQEIRQAQRLDPLSLIINTDVGEMLYYGRRHDEAIDQARRALEMDSAFALAHRLLGFAYMAKRQFAPAIDELEAAARVSGGRLDGLAVLGVAYAEGGRRAEARKVLHHLEYASQHRPDIAHSIAVVLAGLGEEDQAFARLEQAYREHDGSLILLKVNPLFDPLRSDARFQDLMRRVSLVQC
jgi:TolB-like protein/DNA-binding winged helix-turn-helix (wHTH) protein/Tfp pilus assembly protein PilF